MSFAALERIYSPAMKKILGLVALFSLVFVNNTFAYDCQTVDTTIGDRDILVIGGFTFTRPFEYDFAPTNAPSSNVTYTAEFRLVYLNDELPRATDDNFNEVLNTSGLLNGWLREFLDDQYAGADYEELLAKYFDKSLVSDLNRKFPEYLDTKLAEIDSSFAASIHSVTVNVSAKGAFRSALLEKLGALQVR